MNFIKNLVWTSALALTVTVTPVHAQQLEESPETPIVLGSELEEIISTSDAVIGRLLEGDVVGVQESVVTLQAYVDTAPMSDALKQAAYAQLTVMNGFFDTTSATATSPVTFLLASNDLYKVFNEYLYEQPQATPAYMYQLRHLARKLQFQTLEGNWDAIENETADSIVDLVSDIYRNLENPDIWQATIRPINKQLEDGVAVQDVAGVYGAGQGYLNAAPLIETAVLKKVAEDEAEAQAASTNRIFFLIAGVVALALAGYVFYFIRKKKAAL